MHRSDTRYLVCRSLAFLLFGGAALWPLNAQVLSPNLLYTTIVPCRLVDTRVAGGPLVANIKRMFNVVGVGTAGSLSSQGGSASGCPIPGFDGTTPQVQGLLVNLVAVNASGAGDLVAWPSDQSQPTASVINYTPGVNIANGVILPVKQSSPEGGDISIVAQVSGAHLVVDVLGYYSNLSPVTGGSGNVFVGKNAGRPAATTAGNNAAFGNFALASSSTGGFNTAVGNLALQTDTTGVGNTAVGNNALGNLASGSSNIAIGLDAGSTYTGSATGNILIGSNGSSGDDNTLRIGDGASSGTAVTAAFIGGIFSDTSLGASGTEVLIDSSNRLGTGVSSLRFKEDINTMGTASDALMSLRPVTFHYKAPYDDGSRLIQYGLIAEEVAQIYPNLVLLDKEGQPRTVRYSQVNALLLNEVQKQHARIATQTDQIDHQQQEIASQAAQLAAQETRLAELAKELAELKALLQSPR